MFFLSSNLKSISKPAGARGGGGGGRERMINFTHPWLDLQMTNNHLPANAIDEKNGKCHSIIVR